MADLPSIWALKPWWCQPWSILLTGASAPVVSWLLLQRWWVTAPAVVAVLLWWWLFLVMVPNAYRHSQQSAGTPGEGGAEG
ncbi:DUF6737 family protein [Cyanobium sp. NIES-981]|uniref:DUF6737 family protein n=1 Tax=Cyanobium sp. NIES-981 TaxID=1851505 RepID=UPI000B35497D|nr:DUF6737 family protein [Cyanobium sp. NIES-981]